MRSKKQFQKVTGQPTKDKQTILIETKKPEEQKHVLVRFEPRTFAVPGIFVISRLSLSQDTTDSVKRIVNPKTNLYFGLITLANRKRNYNKND